VAADVVSGSGVAAGSRAAGAVSVAPGRAGISGAGLSGSVNGSGVGSSAALDSSVTSVPSSRPWLQAQPGNTMMAIIAANKNPIVEVRLLTRSLKTIFSLLFKE
jgi:hypothetical protein